MVLDQVLFKLQARTPTRQRALELGRLGYIEWLGSLPADADYSHAAMAAYTRAAELRRMAPAVAVFCDLLVQSTRMPIQPLDLEPPAAVRRGGARARRLMH